MIFTAEQCRQILTGRKTQARRLALPRPNLPTPSLDLPELERLRTTGHRVGRVYPLERYARGDELRPEERLQLETATNKRRRPAPTITVAHMRCTELRLQQVGDVDLKDARAEGFKTTDEFRVAWVEARERRRTNQLAETDVVWLIKRMATHSIHDHARTIPDCTTDGCDATLRRFDLEHATTLVWALSFEIVETPRMLKASASYDDYTDRPSRAARAEPEALTEDQLIALNRYTEAKDDARRRRPLATHADNLARELDELRNRTLEEGLHDQGLRTLLLAADRNIQRIKERLGKAA